MNDNKRDFFAAILAIILILLIILIILVCYGIFGYKDEENNVDIYSVNSSFDNQIASTVSKLDEKYELVYDNNISYELDFDGTKFEMNSTMPVINIDSEKIKLINEEISRYYENIQKNEELYELSYDKYIFDDVLSVIIKKVEKRTDGTRNVSNVLVYKINTKTGDTFSNRELMNKKGLSVDKVCLELLNTISRNLRNNYNFDISDKSLLIDNKKTAEEYIKEKICVEKDDNLGNEFKMYFNERGNVCIYFYVPILNTNEKFTYNNFILNL